MRKLLTPFGRRSSGAPAHVLITGATGGIGQALATHYAAAGRILSLTGRDTARLAEIAAQCAARGAQVVAEPLDVTDAHTLEAWIAARDDALAIDLLIANAGIGGAAVVPSAAGESGRLAREILSVNTFGAVNTVTPVLPRMVARRRGHIVMIGSISGSIGMPQSPAYCASKAAVQIYADALRRLVGPHGVRVTAVLPGFVDTPMSRSLDMPRPWCWPADRAARRIARDVARGARRSVFPWQLRTAIALQGYLPLALTDFVLARSARRGRWTGPGTAGDSDGNAA